MALAFVAATSLVAVGGAWAVTLNIAARWGAIALFALFGLALLVPTLAERLMRPLVRLGGRLVGTAPQGVGRSVFAQVTVGIGTGLLWTPCAGPILGLIIAGSALQGPNAGSALLLLAYAAGACTALGVAWWFGRGAINALRRVLPATQGLRRIAGVAVLAGAAVPALGLDASLLTRIRPPALTGLEQALVDRTQPSAAAAPSVAEQGPLAALSRATAWINSPALSAESLRGKVVVVNFWTYSCINCLRTLPHVRAWADKYRDSGLVVIGIHTPEFAFEKSPANVRRAIADLGIVHPVATDNQFAVWRAFHNGSWPAFYFIDAQGRLRHQVAGEHAYERSERVIQTLLAEAGRPAAPSEPAQPEGRGTQASPDLDSLRSGEAYVGYDKATAFSFRAPLQRDRDATYTTPASLRSNEWALAGQWRVEAERAVLKAPRGRIQHRFRARDLHMVLGPTPDGRPVRFRVLLDGKSAGVDHGSDTDATGHGVIDRQKLYQLIRQRGPVGERLFEIEFLDDGVEAYAFTFG